MSDFVPAPVSKPNNLNGQIISSPVRDASNLGITSLFDDLGRVIQSTTETIAGTTAGVLGSINKVDRARQSQNRVRPDDQSRRGGVTRAASDNKDSLFVIGGLLLGGLGIFIALK